MPLQSPSLYHFPYRAGDLLRKRLGDLLRKRLGVLLLLAASVASLALWAAPAVQADVLEKTAGPFFCAAAEVSDGDGTIGHPWSCQTPDQFQIAVAKVCRAGGGPLYFIFSDGYIQYTVAADCTVNAGPPQNGQPPDTGVAVPAPWLLTAGAALGLVLLAAGALRASR